MTGPRRSGGVWPRLRARALPDACNDPADDAAAIMALRAALDSLPVPAVPAGLRERIVRQALIGADLSAGRIAPLRPVPSPGLGAVPVVMPARTAGQWRARTGGLATLAAGLALLAVVAPHARPSWQSGRVARAVTVVGETARGGKVVQLATAEPRPIKRHRAVQPVASRDPAIVAPEPAAVTPAAPPAVDAGVDATMPALPVDLAKADVPLMGPVDDSHAPVSMPAHQGFIGPVLPQAYGFTGGTAGREFHPAP